MPYRPLRLVFVLVALGGFAAFGLTLWDFIEHRDAYLARFDVAEFEEEMPKTEDAGDHRHLKNWDEGYYDVVHKSNVTGVVRVVDDPSQPVEVKKVDRIVPSDLILKYVQWAGNESTSLAYIQPSKVPQRAPKDVRPDGDLYVAGDSFTIEKEPSVKITVLAVRENEVVVGVEGQDDDMVLGLGEFVVTTNTIRSATALDATPSLSGPPALAEEIGTFPEQTVQDGDEVLVGSSDMEAIARMPKDVIFADFKVEPARDPDTGEIRGLRVDRIKAGSILERQGFKPGDVIISVNGYPTKDRAEVMQWLQGQGDQRSFIVEVERLGTVRSLRYRVPSLR